MLGMPIKAWHWANIVTVMDCFGPAGNMEVARRLLKPFVTFHLRNQQFTWFISFFFGSQAGIAVGTEFGSCSWVQLHSRCQWSRPLENGGRLFQIYLWGLHCSFTHLVFLPLPCIRLWIKLYNSPSQHHWFGALEVNYTVLFELWIKTHLIIYWVLCIIPLVFFRIYCSLHSTIILHFLI